MSKTQQIGNEHLRLEVASHVGASPVGLEFFWRGAWHALWRPTSDNVKHAGPASPCSSFTLAPFSNRLRDARFVFENQTQQLRPTASDGSTQHGDVRNRPWRILEQSNDTLRCQITSTDFEDFNFPFAFCTTVEYRIENTTLYTTLKLQNIGPQSMPAGFGIHPYFVRGLPGQSQDCLVQFQAQGIYETDQTLIPVRQAQAIPASLNFENAKTPPTNINHVYGGWKGQLHLQYPNTGVVATLEADPIFSHLVVFSAPDGHLALEPVTNATDGFNLLAQGVPNTGVVVLAPGETLQGNIRLSVASTVLESCA